MRRVRGALILAIAAGMIPLALAGGCVPGASGTDTDAPDAPPAVSREDGDPEGEPSQEYLSGDDPLLVAREQLARDSGMQVEALVAQVVASAVDGQDVWLRVTVENPSVPGIETEAVYLVSEDEGPWRIVVYGTGVGMGDLAAYGASAEVERGLFYWVSVNDAAYEYLAEADEGRYATLHTVRQRFLDLGDDGFWALLDLAEYSSEERVILLMVLDWDLEAGNWSVVAHGQTPYAVSEEPPEQLLSGPWTNDIRY